MLPLKTHISKIEEATDYYFDDVDHITLALSHSSRKDLDIISNQRLEFLGDRVLGLVIAEYLFANFPDADEGPLSKHLNYLVSKGCCAIMARKIGLGSAILMSPSEENNGGRENENILGDATEALIAAIYFDGGYDHAKRVILTLWQDLLAAPYDDIDPKSALQEWSQARKYGIPIYELTDRKGPDHAPEFTVCVTVNNLNAVGVGPSKRLAERKAAELFLEDYALIRGD